MPKVTILDEDYNLVKSLNKKNSQDNSQLLCQFMNKYSKSKEDKFYECIKIMLNLGLSIGDNKQKIIQLGREDIIDIYLQKGYNEIIPTDLEYIYTKYVRREKCERFTKIFNKLVAVVDMKDSEILEDANKCHYELKKILIDSNIEISVENFIRAIKTSNEALVEILLDRKVLDNNFDEQYMMLACEVGNGFIIESLCNAGFKMTKKAFATFMKDVHKKNYEDMYFTSDTVELLLHDKYFVPDLEDILLMISSGVIMENCTPPKKVTFTDAYYRLCMEKGTYPFKLKDYPIECLRHECELGRFKNVQLLINYGINLIRNV